MSQELFEYIEDSLIECQHCGSPVFFEEVSIQEDVDTGELFVDCPECMRENTVSHDDGLLDEGLLKPTKKELRRAYREVKREQPIGMRLRRATARVISSPFFGSRVSNYDQMMYHRMRELKRRQLRQARRRAMVDKLPGGKAFRKSTIGQALKRSFVPTEKDYLRAYKEIKRRHSIGTRLARTTKLGVLAVAPPLLGINYGYTKNIGIGRRDRDKAYRMAHLDKKLPGYRALRKSFLGRAARKAFAPTDKEFKAAYRQVRKSRGFGSRAKHLAQFEYAGLWPLPGSSKAYQKAYDQYEKDVKKAHRVAVLNKLTGR